MSIFSFIVDDELFTELNGYFVEVQTQDSHVFIIDESGLKQWCIGIVDDVVNERTCYDELIEESIGIRITSPQKTVLVDTISSKY